MYVIGLKSLDYRESLYTRIKNGRRGEGKKGRVSFPDSIFADISSL